jgi:MFS family permease
MIVLLCLGSVYAWSVFRKPLESELSITASASMLPYTIALVFYATFMPITGFYIPKIGTRLTTAIGGAIVSLGYILASYSNDIATLSLCYGAIAGTGVGIAYGVPMAVVARWFPEKKGLAVGLTIIGFGLSPLITAPLANLLINSIGVRATLRILGISFGLIIIGIAIALRLPPPNWQSLPNPSQTHITHHHYPKQMLKSRTFYGLWCCYCIGTFVGLSAIGISSPIAIEVIQLSPNQAANAISFFAVFNGISRPLFGWLSDRFKPSYIATFSYTLILISSLIMINAKSGQIATYIIAFSLLWFCLGGWLAMAPTLTLRFFDPDQYLQNYGIVFTAYGVGALVGTLITGQTRDWFGNYLTSFYLMAVLSILGIIIANFTLNSQSKTK